jgi:biopolymer transport protein ExbD
MTMAGSSSARAPAGAITGINVTPLVDVTLVLLIIFMVTAKLIVHHQALPVDLPRAASGEQVQEVLAVVLLADGSIQVDGLNLPDDDAVLARARAAVSAHGDLRATLQADGRVPHARVMHLLDLLKQAGVGKVGFGVVPEQSTTPGVR